MPFYRPPGSDFDRLAFMRRAVGRAAQPREGGTTHLSAETVAALTETLTRFQTTYDNLSTQLGARTREVQEKGAALAELEVYVRDFAEGLRRRVRRQRLSAQVFNLYGLPQDGSLPKGTTADDWIGWGLALVEGETKALAAGYAAMSNPSAAELRERLVVAQEEATQVGHADDVFDQAQLAVAALRPAVDALIEEIVEEVRFATRRQDAPSQRRVLRTYGARFGYLPDEPRDPDDSDEAPPAEEPAP